MHILDISTRGMLAMMSEAPPVGTIVEIRVGRHWLAGHVRWRGPKRFGISFRDRVSVAALLAGDESSALLAKTAGGCRRPSGMTGAFAMNARAFGLFIQFVLLVGVLGLLALVLHSWLTSSLGPLQLAEAAMAGAAVTEPARPPAPD